MANTHQQNQKNPHGRSHRALLSASHRIGCTCMVLIALIALCTPADRLKANSSLAPVIKTSISPVAEPAYHPMPLLSEHPSQGHLTDHPLPILGDRVSAISSPEKEHTLGRAWLRSLRRQASLIQDPLLNDYLESLIYRLASHSGINSPDIELVIVNSETINAFAVPGGIVGVNAGLLLHSDEEDELASVLAHELAHLSQRHYARNSEHANRTKWAGIAALLASVALMATTGGDPGIAALATTQALAVQNQLRYSREHEREADRIGMQALSRAGLDPHAMPRFFEKLHSNSRYMGELPPEFLLTHPVTQSRISDSKNRASKYPAQHYTPHALEYSLMRARVLSAYTSDTMDNVKQFQSALGEETPETLNKNKHKNKKRGVGSAANRYGLVRALLKANRYDEAYEALHPLREADPRRITYVITEAEVLMAKNDYEAATALLKEHLNYNPGNYPLSIYYAQNLLRIKEASRALPIIEQQLTQRPNNTYLWRLLSEAQGALENIVGVHQARAEVLFLHNETDGAIQQLKYALRLTKANFQLTAKIEHRIQEIFNYRQAFRVR